MSKPFFIWTMRRTGGTSITELLMEMSEHKNMQHEPFNWDRELGNVTREFRSQLEAGEIEMSTTLHAVFRDSPLIKHCYEVFHNKFNEAIINAIKKEHYKHIFLLRKNEKSRLFSLLLAFQTEVWGKHGSEKIYDLIHNGEKTIEPFNLEQLIKEEKRARNSTNYIKEMLDKQNIQFKVVYFEDLFIGEKQQREKKLYELFDYIELDKNITQNYHNMIYHNLYNRSQNSNSIFPYVPNLKEAEELLEQRQGNE